MKIDRRRGRFALLETAVALLLLAAGCASLASTPAQDLALSHWTACHARVTGTDLNAVRSDGRISFWYTGAGEGHAMQACLREAGEAGGKLPEPIAELRPAGSGGSGGM